MEPLERLANLIEQTLVPLIKSVLEEVKGLAKDMQDVRLHRQKDSGRIDVLEGYNRENKSKMESNTEIMRGHGSRIAKLEAHAEEGHKQNEQCREKNKLVEDALRLAKENKRKNEEQEKRHIVSEKDQKERSQKIVNRLWGLILAVMSAAAAGWFSHFWNIPKGG